MASNHKTILGNPKGLKINDKNRIPMLEMNSRNAISVDKIMVTGNKIIRITHLIL